MGNYYTKERLYGDIHKLKKKLGLNINEYGFSVIDLCRSADIKIENVNFRTNGLRGMAAVGVNNLSDVILLNASRNKIEQNYDCGHELIHLNLHRNLESKLFNCIDSVKPDNFLEWQANEGSAELLVPYSVFVPLIKMNHNYLLRNNCIGDYKISLSKKFNVTQKVIEYRLESLKYEIHQHIKGVPLDQLEILSTSKQKENKISIKSLNEIEKDLEIKSMNNSVIKSRSFISFNNII